MKNKILKNIEIDLNMEGYKAPYEEAYLIAITPRSGSTMLCDLLTQTNLMGKPNEYLNPDYINDRINKYSDKKSLAEMFTKTIEYGMNNKKMFGIKASYYQVEPFIEKKIFNILLPNIKVINLFRRNILKQAISLYIAAETKFFHTGDNEEKRSELLNNLKFDKNKIFNRISEIYQEELGWISYLDNNSYSYLKLFYEDNIKDMNKIIKMILLYNGIEEEVALKTIIKESKFKKISNTINDDFYKQYLSDLDIFNKTLKLGISKNRLI